ncbi:hypothetical protein [Methylobrevis pamukkalensis]|uniref:Uncharacterized protein n=1 Tax=Methylobrevis pamukkalensis TaxID=1439726 RepID=A0A1E3H307_9HYPH|nr:hypothetical protein [Methylobrevis pamukkalensis]ODN70196.1 hypothetical protein A6302_02470 [Methylobrevis pamukkalensis]
MTDILAPGFAPAPAPDAYRAFLESKIRMRRRPASMSTRPNSIRA